MSPNTEDKPIPFPASTSAPVQSRGDKQPSEHTLQASASVAESSTSSNLTSSDKLTALPSTPNVGIKGNRSPAPSTRGFRRSFDASNSSANIPSVKSTGDLNALGLTLGPPAWSNSPKQPPRPSVSDSGHDTPRGRVSLDSSVRQAFARGNRASDPTYTSQAFRAEQLREEHSPSNSRSRAASPLRILQQWSQGLHRHHRHEEPFVPVDPFTLNWHFHWPNLSCHTPSFCCLGSSEDEEHQCYSCSQFRQHTTGIKDFLMDSLPRIIYLYALLQIPAMYFSRVARIFEDADVSRPDIQRMIDACSRPGYHLPLSSSVNVNTNASRHPTSTGIGIMGHVGAAALVSDVDIPLTAAEDWTAPFVSPALVRFKHSWEAFIDSLLREWKTLNVVSALLLSAILTMFQIPDAATDPVTRTAALLSLICALMSLSYGCMYIVRFGTMRTMYRASRWAEEARKNDTMIWWNVWVMLAMPAVWMSWSMVLFIVSILSFVWRTGSVNDPPERDPLSTHAILGPRIAITGVFAIGMIYFFLIVRTLKSYGTHWVLSQRRISALDQPDPLGRGRGRERPTPDTRPVSDEVEPPTSAAQFTATPEKMNVKLERDGLGVEVQAPSVHVPEREHGRLWDVFRMGSSSHESNDLEKGEQRPRRKSLPEL